MRGRTLFVAAVMVLAALALTTASSVGAGGQLQLYLVNSGPETTFYNESSITDGNCDPYTKPGSLSTKTGKAGQFDSPGYAFGSDPHASTLTYTVPAGGGFTVPANKNAVMFKMWAYSG